MTSSFFCVFFWFLYRGVDFSREGRVCDFLLTYVGRCVRTFSQGINSLERRSYLSQVLYFFGRLISVRPIYSLSFDNGQLFVHVGSASDRELKYGNPPSSPCDSLFYALFFGVCLQFVSFFVRFANDSKGPSVFFVQGLLVSRGLVVPLRVFQCLGDYHGLCSLRFLQVFGAFRYACVFVFFRERLRFILVRVYLRRHVFQPISLRGVLYPI